MHIPNGTSKIWTRDFASTSALKTTSYSHERKKLIKCRQASVRLCRDGTYGNIGTLLFVYRLVSRTCTVSNVNIDIPMIKQESSWQRVRYSDKVR